MAETLKASEQGLQLVYSTIRQKGWTKTQTALWWTEAQTSQATLRRFWRGIAIERYAFQQICRVAGVDWRMVVEGEGFPTDAWEEEETVSGERVALSRSRLIETCRILSLLVSLELSEQKSY